MTSYHCILCVLDGFQSVLAPIPYVGMYVREENLVCDMIFKCPEAKREVRGVLFISVSLIPLLACLQQRSVAGSLYFAVASPMYEYVQSLHSLLRLSRRCVFLVVFGYSTCGMFVQSRTFSLK